MDAHLLCAIVVWLAWARLVPRALADAATPRRGRAGSGAPAAVVLWGFAALTFYLAAIAP